MATRIARILTCVSLLLPCAGCNDALNASFLNGFTLEGFEQKGPVMVYNRDNLFDYIDGEADVYLPHGFRLLYRVNFRKQTGGPLMNVDVYDMSGVNGARSVFEKCVKDGKTRLDGPGDEAARDDLTVIMRRGRCFVRILPSDSAEEKVPAKVADMLVLARRLDALLTRIAR